MSVFNGAESSAQARLFSAEALGSARSRAADRPTSDLGLLVTLCNLSSLLPRLRSDCSMRCLSHLEDGANADVIDHEGRRHHGGAATERLAGVRIWSCQSLEHGVRRAAVEGDESVWSGRCRVRDSPRGRKSNIQSSCWLCVMRDADGIPAVRSTPRARR